MSHSSASHLRARAGRLRRLAERMESAPAMRLDADAGPDTWRGPRADRCLVELRLAQHGVHRAADDLRWQAWCFERRADEIEAAALLEALG